MAGTKKIFLISYAILLCIPAVMSGQQKPKDHSRPRGYVTYFRCGSLEGAEVLWFYDSLGRIVTDSIRPLNEISPVAPHTTVHYRYKEDSVIGMGNDGYEIAIRLNENGLPMFTNDPNQRKYFAEYNDDGTLRRINEQRDRMFVAYDSFVYVNGNIVSFRSRYEADKDYLQWTCTYYPDKEAQPFFGPLLPFALRVTSIFTTGISMQNYSRNLLKSVTFSGGGSKPSTRLFTYKFDKNGNLGEMNRVIKQPPWKTMRSFYKFYY